MKHDIFISTDVEADGKVPTRNSMLSFGSAAYDINKNLLGTFSVNLEEFPGASPDPLTMSEFWNKNPDNSAAYAETRKNLKNPKIAMQEYKQWIESLGSNYVFVGYPAPYDFMWISFYFLYFLGESPFNHSRCLDAKSFAMATLKKEKLSYATKRNMPRNWFDNIKHTHVAVDDAVEQGALFINMLRANLGLSRLPDVIWP